MIKQCARPECHVLFSSNGVLCPQCKSIEDEALNTIKDLLIERPHLSVIEIYRETGIAMAVIKSLVQSGRLEILDSQNCHRCGLALDEKIRDSYLCSACMRKMRKQLDVLHEAGPNSLTSRKLKTTYYGLSSRETAL